MDFALTQEQEQFANEFRTYLKTAMTPELITEMEVEGEYGGPVSRAFFRKLGSDGWLGIAIHGGHLTASNPDILKSPILPHEIHLHQSRGGHAGDWLNSIRTRRETVAPSEAGHRTSSLCHLGLIAMIVGRKLKWDPDREIFPDDPEATRMVFRPMRSPWHI